MLFDGLWESFSCEIIFIDFMKDKYFGANKGDYYKILDL